jgi:tryptophan 2,3-dioxygenase
VLKYLELDDAARARLERRANEPSLYDHVKALLQRRGFDVDSPAALVESFRRIYTDEERYYDLHVLLEDLIEFDERLLLWRGRHVRMVERMIGHKKGTGGSAGVDYLARTLDYRVFPELWEVRTLLGTGASYG